MVLDLIPFAEVNKTGFLQMVKTLNPKSSLRSDKYYRDMLHKTYLKSTEAIKASIEKKDPNSKAVVLDGWSEFHNCYLKINLHYFTKYWTRKIIYIACCPVNEAHTRENLAYILKLILQEWNVCEKVSLLYRILLPT